jgi:hypothetical protein
MRCNATKEIKSVEQILQLPPTDNDFVIDRSWRHANIQVRFYHNLTKVDDFCG